MTAPLFSATASVPAQRRVPIAARYCAAVTGWRHTRRPSCETPTARPADGRWFCSTATGSRADNGRTRASALRGYSHGVSVITDRLGHMLPRGEGGTAKEKASEVGQEAQKVRHSRAFRFVARVGLAARALVYLMLGGLIIEIAVRGHA